MQCARVQTAGLQVDMQSGQTAGSFNELKDATMNEIIALKKRMKVDFGI